MISKRACLPLSPKFAINRPNPLPVSSKPPLPADPALRTELAAGLDNAAGADAIALAAMLARSFGDGTVAIIHYGSHAQHSDARRESAFDFFVMVKSIYRDAYESLARSVGTSYTPRTASVLNRVLPPNVIAVNDEAHVPPLAAKCAVLSLDDLRRACSPNARDHFVRGRLFQYVQLPWARDDEARSAVTDAIIDARVGTFSWGLASLPPTFDAEEYFRALLERSFSGEIRPERGGRIDALLGAQREIVLRVYDALLQQLARERILATSGKVYRLTQPVRALQRLRTGWYFRSSKVRATARWMKYVVLYDDWLDYVVRKIARRSGVTIELTARERRWPLIFSGPKPYNISVPVLNAVLINNVHDYLGRSQPDGARDPHDAGLRGDDAKTPGGRGRRAPPDDDHPRHLGARLADVDHWAGGAEVRRVETFP